MAEPVDTMSSTDPEQTKEITHQLEQDEVEASVNSIIEAEKIYQLWWRWADFHLFFISPTIEQISPPVLILPEPLPGLTELEFVYPIYDHGYKLSTSKGQDIYSAGLSMCKLFFTIEKMIYLLVERIKAVGGSSETEVQVAFDGHELARRKCFESIINLSYNVVVTNFDPGVWGERYLQIAKRLADMGYGYPPESPRDNYRKSHNSSPGVKH